MTALFVLVLPALAIWSWLDRIGLRALTRLGAAIALSVAASGTAYLLWRFAGGSPGVYAVLDPIAWTVTAAAGLVLGRRRAGVGRAFAISPATLALAGLAAVQLALAATIVFWRVTANPHGDWDAWAIWNMTARFLAEPSGEWRAIFDAVPLMTHPDYPLLLPSAVARGWTIGGSLAPWVPIAIGLSIGGAAALLMCGSLLQLRGPAAAAIGLALLVVPTFIQHASSQLADVAVAGYTLLALALLAQRPPSAGALALAGAAAGLAGWTKNEGLIVAAAVPAGYVLSRWRQDGRHAAYQAAIDITIGLWPVLLVTAVFKLTVAWENDVVQGLFAPGALRHWSDGTRVALVVRYMTGEAWQWGGWAWGSPVWLLLAVALLGRRGETPRNAAVSAAGFALAAQAATFFAVYVMTPHSVAWHMTTSWSRLIAQMWPAAVWWGCARFGSRGVNALAGEPPRSG